MDLLAMKFGGTSMGTAERIRVAGQLCAREKKSGR
jgi:aspartokinase